VSARRLFRRVEKSGTLLLVARLVLGGLFVYMGCFKIAEPIEFLKLIRLYGLLPEQPPYFLNTTAIVLPYLEVLCGLALIVGVMVRGASLTILGMLLVFTPVILLRAAAIHSSEGTPWFQIAFDCGCGSGVVVIWQKVLGNCGLILLSTVGLWSRSRRFCLDLWLDGRKRPLSYCRRCGYALDAGEEHHCRACAEQAPLSSSVVGDAPA